jgi:hypothetical protein
MKKAFFWDVALCRSCMTWRFRGTYCLADFSTLKMEAIRYSETSAHTRLHSATSKKTAFFRFVHVSNLATQGLFQYTIQFSHGGSEEVYKNCMSGFWISGRDLNQALLEYIWTDMAWRYTILFVPKEAHPISDWWRRRRLRRLCMCCSEL